jgi:hypothetical protein
MVLGKGHWCWAGPSSNGPRAGNRRLGWSGPRGDEKGKKKKEKGSGPAGFWLERI